MITAEVNSLGDGKCVLTVEQVQKKWADLKSQSKSAIMKYNKAIGKTGGGTNSVKQPSEVQYKVVGIIGRSATKVICGTEECGTSAKELEPTGSSSAYPTQ